MEIAPLSPQLGAEVRGVEVARATDAQFDAIHRAWLAHGVLRFRGQRLDDRELERYSARFGPLEKMPLGRLYERFSDAELLERLRADTLYVTRISNIVEDGRPLGGLGHGETSWHSDMSYVETPPTASVLYALEVPPAGGETHFASQYAAYDALPTALRERIADLHIKHDAAHDSVGALRPGFARFGSPRDAPGAVHEIVRRHPETGRPALFLGRREWASIPELPLSEGEKLLDELWSFATLAEHCYTQEWRVGDLVVWDNRCVLHRRSAFAAGERRMMHRCQVLARR